MKNIIIGIDISKKTLDICLKEGQSISYLTIENKTRAIKGFLNGYMQKNVIIAMENTGRYNWALLEALEPLAFKVYVISPLHLKKSIGIARGKNDKVDAFRICSFIEKNQQEIPQWKPSTGSIKKIKILLAERALRIKMKKQLSGQQHDYKLMKSTGLDKSLLKLNQGVIKCVEGQIKTIEESIEKIISDDHELKQQHTLAKSVPGVGKVLSWMFLSKTDGFTSITNPRKMACYSGVVPFDFQSGTSIRKRRECQC